MIISFACLVNPTEQNAKGAAVGIYLFIVFFAFTILPLPWIYPPEINPLRTRTTASAISTCTNWLCNFAVVMFTPKFIETSNWVVICRSLEEIDIIFAKAHVEGRQPWRVAATLPKLSLQEIEAEGNSLGLYDEDFEKDNYETKENISDSTSNNGNGAAGGMFEKSAEEDNTAAGSEEASNKV
ncbi:Sugar (and other) transporter family protein [Candida parapsilosis]|uniref:Sugar (And other) transporter family protein n=1 Tax=Candida parapsilosis TaxID=5480 RepID=A0A8X7T8K8_CANPA|nr:Sugar (and other) transporter family protein [Candida parapsilosis]